MPGNWRTLRLLSAIAVRFAGPEGSKLLDAAGRAIQGVAIGVIGTALLEGVLAWIGFAIAGVPGAIALAAVTFFFADPNGTVSGLASGRNMVGVRGRDRLGDFFGRSGALFCSWGWIPLSKPYADRAQRRVADARAVRRGDRRAGGLGLYRHVDRRDHTGASLDGAAGLAGTGDEASCA